MIQTTTSSPAATATGRALVISQLNQMQQPAPFVRPAAWEMGTQTTNEGLPSSHLPPKKRPEARAYGQRHVPVGVPLYNPVNLHAATPSQNQGTQVPGVEAVTMVHPAMPNTMHYLPDVPGNQVASGPVAFLRQRGF